MTNPYFVADGTPAIRSALQSSKVRDQFARLGLAFDKLPTLTPNEPVFVNAGGTAMITKTPSDALSILGLSVYDHVALSRFGADITGTVSATSALADACTFLGPKGGAIFVNSNEVFLFDTSPTLAPNCHLVGPHINPGTPGSNASAPYGQVGGKILLNSAATINKGPGCCITGLYVIRKGMTFPAANASAYAGTAITSTGDDGGVLRCLIIGFNKAFVSNGFARNELDICFDCNPALGDGAVELTNLHDSSPIFVHGWPYGTIESYYAATSGGTINLAANAPKLHRDGSGVKIRNSADDVTINGLTYGYIKGLDAVNASGFQIDTLWSDSTRFHAGSEGFSIGAGVANFSANQLRAYGQTTPFNLAPGTLQKFSVAFLHAQYGLSDNIILGDGDFHFGKIVSYDSGGAGLVYNSSSCRMSASSYSESGNAYANPIKNNIVAARHEDMDVVLHHTDKADGVALIGGSAMSDLQINSASTVNIPLRYRSFIMLGTTNIDNIGGGSGCREIDIMFNGILTMNNGTGNLKLNGNFTTNQGSSIRLMWSPNLTKWIERSRSQNA